MLQKHPLREAVNLVGLGVMAKALGLTGPAIRKWERAGRMPRTEWTGETCYCQHIEAMTHGRVTAAQLKSNWPELAKSSAARSCAAPVSDAQAV